MNKDLKPGSYNAYVRAKTGGTNKAYSFYQVNNDVDSNIKVTASTINSTQYNDFLVGRVEYDGSYNLRISDWVQAGVTVDQVYLVPVS